MRRAKYTDGRVMIECINDIADTMYISVLLLK